jgi:hypothetical protein
LKTLALAPTFAPLPQLRADWLTSQTRSVRGVVPRRALHASRDAPCHSSAQPPLLGGLPPPHEAFQEHAAHLVEWSMTLSSKGSLGTCIPKGVSTFFHTAFTAHSGSDAGADAGGSQVRVVRPCHGDSALRLFGEARLDKMLIEGKSPPDAQFLHDKEGDAIRERVILVLMALEICPPLVK